MEFQDAAISSATETPGGSIFSDLCDLIEGRRTPTPIIRFSEKLDARALVAGARDRAAAAPELAGTVVPILVSRPQDVLGALFTVGHSGGVPLVLNGPRPYESAASMQSRVDHVGQTVKARFVYKHDTWQPVSRHSVPERAYPDTAFLQFSSGSVGSPRPLRISHRAIRAPVRTGDLGFMADGELVFTGREAEVLRMAGEDFLPSEVEHFLVRRGFAKAGRVAVVGVAEEAMTRMVAVIESDSALGDDAAAAARRRDLLRSARHAALPLTEVRFVPKNWLSKTTSGKLRRRRIAAELMEGSR